jgi:hypothetical protein
MHGQRNIKNSMFVCGSGKRVAVASKLVQSEEALNRFRTHEVTDRQQDEVVERTVGL